LCRPSKVNRWISNDRNKASKKCRKLLCSALGGMLEVQAFLYFGHRMVAIEDYAAEFLEH
jgi:hypothetical protein